MKLTVSTKLNPRQTITMEFDGKMDEVLRGANAIMAFRGECGLCGEKDILLQSKVAQEFNFIEFVCTKCGAKAQWGNYRGGGYFLKKWEVYQAGTSAPPSAPPEVNVDDEGRPF